MRLLPILLVLIASVAECLMMSRVLVPQYKLVGDDALLKCEYDLGRDRLYAVKWYKDNEEFFRYVPRFNPPIYTHSVEGVRVESSKSNDKRVLLRTLTVRSTGVYRCEVSAEAPSFASIMGEGRMTVVYLPKEAPQITGVNGREEYEVGDVLDLNCTSAKSFPPAKLSWYINDSPVEVPWSISLHPAPTDPPPSTTKHQHQSGLVTTPSRHSAFSSYNSHLMISTLRLQLTLESSHFGMKGTAKVRCVARISPLFWQDGDERILGHHGRHSKKKTEEQLHRIPITSSSNSAVAYEDNDDFQSPPVEASQDSMHNSHEQQHISYHSHHHRHKTLLQYDLGEEDDEGHYFYGFGELPAFQREALVFVRGAGCSTTNLSYYSRWAFIWSLLSILNCTFPGLG